jgi:hypothetical protein
MPDNFTMKETIQVTQEHIQNGSRGSAVGCPIHHALRPVMGDQPFIVAPISIRSQGEPANRTLFKLSGKLARYISDTDNRKIPYRPIALLVDRENKTIDMGSAKVMCPWQH